MYVITFFNETPKFTDIGTLGTALASGTRRA
jgi:hypothetical protein